MAMLEDIRFLTKEKKDDFMSSVKAELASMKAEKAKKLRAELLEFVKQEYEKNNDSLHAQRKHKLKATEDMDADDGGSPPVAASSPTTGPLRATLRRSNGRPSASRSMRSGSAPLVRTHQDADEHLRPTSSSGRFTTSSRSLVR